MDANDSPSIIFCQLLIFFTFVLMGIFLNILDS